MADDTANPRSIRAILSRIKAHFKRVRPGKKEREDDERFFARIHEDLNCSKVAISSLTEDEIEKVFKLKKDGNPIFDIPVAELFPVPDRLEEDLADIQEFLGRDPNNGAACRLRVDVMLRDCIKNERLWLANQTPTSRPKNQLCFTLENHLEMVVKNNRRQELWNGVADYSVWYDDESMGTSLIVVEAKSRQTFCEGLRQCLGYLAMVHTIRKRNFHGNAIVYGVVTNGYSFTFLRVDNESRWAKWNSPDDWNDHTSSRIYTLLRLIIRNAASTSPRSSPSKVKKGLKDTIATSDPARYHIQIGSSSSEGRMGVTSPSS